MSLLDPALRRVIATGKTEFRPYDRFGKVVPGMTWLPLSRESEDGGPGCFLIRFEPGGASRPHEHVETEEFLLLEGRLEDCDGRVFEAGDFVSYEAGSRHFSVSPEGCLIFVILRAPNRPLETA
ncbi:MAG: cupin domain-containing protein [Rhodospirillales bacterium]|nr:cupin domain-containing protein [Rhodospirillales bacterium]